MIFDECRNGCLSFGTTPQPLEFASHCALPGYQALPPEISFNRGAALGISENFVR